VARGSTATGRSTAREGSVVAASGRRKSAHTGNVAFGSNASARTRPIGPVRATTSQHWPDARIQCAPFFTRRVITWSVLGRVGVLPHTEEPGVGARARARARARESPRATTVPGRRLGRVGGPCTSRDRKRTIWRPHTDRSGWAWKKK
jgi:hypothetical protein